jgi:general secretion pathway protein I
MVTWEESLRSGSSTRGFTLIEILVALAVIAVALTAVVAETSQHLTGAVHMRDRTLAHWVAMNRIAETQIAGAWPAAGTSNGTTVMANREWYWSMKVSETPDNTIRRIDVEVRMDKGQSKPDATAIAYLERPL